MLMLVSVMRFFASGIRLLFAKSKITDMSMAKDNDQKDVQQYKNTAYNDKGLSDNSPIKTWNDICSRFLRTNPVPNVALCFLLK